MPDPPDFEPMLEISFDEDAAEPRRPSWLNACGVVHVPECDHVGMDAWTLESGKRLGRIAGVAQVFAGEPISMDGEFADSGGLYYIINAGHGRELLRPCGEIEPEERKLRLV